jgi:cytochrome P450
MTENSKYNVWSQATRNNPHPLYRQMRENDPAFRVIDGMGQTVWFFTRYADSVSILKDKRAIKNPRKSLSPEVLQDRFGIDPNAETNKQSMWDVVNLHMLNQDPPDHTHLRSIVHKAFTPQRVRDLQPRIEQITIDLLDAMEHKPDGDLVEDFALPLPITVIAEMLGIPVEDRDKFRKWTTAIVSGDTSSMEMIMEFGQYMNNMIEMRRKADTGDILSALVRVEDDGRHLEQMELLSMLFLLLVAGHETTVNLIANGMLDLLQHPDQFQMLHDNPDLTSQAIEEMLRYNGPVDGTTERWASEDIEWHDGRIIKAGDVLIPLLLGTNRDPEVFDNPETFDITRNPNPHIAFGQGIHFCLGAPLARMEGNIAISKLIDRFPNMSLNIDPSEVQRGNSLLLHNLSALPMTYR